MIGKQLPYDIAAALSWAVDDVKSFVEEDPGGESSPDSIVRKAVIAKLEYLKDHAGFIADALNRSGA